jgi:two-component system, NtrC family, response regulator
MGKVLLLEDDQSVIDAVLQTISKLDHKIVVSPNYHEGFANLKSEKYDLVILQISPNQSINRGPLIKIEEAPLRGWTSLDRIRKFCISSVQNATLEPEIIVIAREELSNEAKSAAENGVFDYIQLPYRRDDKDNSIFDHENFKKRLTASVIRAFSVFNEIDLIGIIGRNYLVRKAIVGLADASRTDFNVLITGETGTGKKLFARKIHENSQLKNNPFVVVDCGSIQKLDHFLFQTNGSTLSDTTSPGTILFHDIHCMPIDIQIELFDYLHESVNITSQDMELAQPKPRIIASTSKNKEDLIGKGQFIEDLFHELSFFQIFLPPLRERTNDIPALAEHFVHLFSSQGKRDFNYKMSKEFLAHLEAYNWPGNLNELINIINLAISNAAGGDLLTPVHLPDKIVSLNLKTDSRRSQPVMGKGMSVFSTAGKDYFQQLADKRASDILKTSDNKKMEAVTLKREALSRILSDTGEKKFIESRPQKLTEHFTEDSKDRATIKFYQSGDHWEIGPSDGTGSFDDLIGFRHLHFLLRYPNRWFTPEEVYNGDIETPTDAQKKFVLDAKTDDKEYESIKKKSKNELIETLKELNTIEDSLSEDPAFETRRKELIYLTKQCLEDRKGFGDSDRSSKARINVTKSIGRAISKVNEKMPSFKKYFNKETIKTGNSIVYIPDPSNTPNWILFKPKT